MASFYVSLRSELVKLTRMKQLHPNRHCPKNHCLVALLNKTIPNLVFKILLKILSIIWVVVAQAFNLKT